MDQTFTLLGQTRCNRRRGRIIVVIIVIPRTHHPAIARHKHRVEEPHAQAAIELVKLPVGFVLAALRFVGFKRRIKSRPRCRFNLCDAGLARRRTPVLTLRELILAFRHAYQSFGGLRRRIRRLRGVLRRGTTTQSTHRQ
ncbi:MAG: hypothetical protein B7X35_05095 [Halothiobacillus sp. 14-56-357]|nr:MAG: hypothetical protein B7X35_05095 [Halothiobacillus sp. 14-56-357]OZB79411.1 MAG: hypothetical protein B7X29_00660 [Halothiobacillus sp. 13-55-115]